MENTFIGFFFYFAEAGKRISHRVYVVYAGMEPMTFKALFPYWNDTPDVIRIQKQVCNFTLYAFTNFFSILLSAQLLICSRGSVAEWSERAVLGPSPAQATSSLICSRLPRVQVLGHPRK